MGNVKPKKHLGQHFLRDANIARKIVGCLDSPADTVVEIGPGTGALTRFLVETTSRLILVEFDGESVEWLNEHYDSPKVEIHHGDFMKWDPEKYLNSPAFFIGNLPYNVSSPIFFHLLAHRNWVEKGVFMIQKEVAERICAPPGSKTYGILSVLLGYYFDLKYEFTVSPKVFLPPPKVKSAVLTLARKENPGPVEFEQLRKVVKSAFGQRRKTLRNALKAFSFPEGEEWTILLGRRAETLSLKEFEQLAMAAVEKEDS